MRINVPVLRLRAFYPCLWATRETTKAEMVDYRSALDQAIARGKKRNLQTTREIFFCQSFARDNTLFEFITRLDKRTRVAAEKTNSRVANTMGARRYTISP